MDFSTPEGRLDKLHATIVEGEGSVLAVVHDYPDPDCIAAAFALQRLLDMWEIPCVIAYGGGMGRAENKAMVGLLNLELREFDTLDLAGVRGAVLVDTQPGVGNNSLPESVPALGVIDHHPVGKEVKDAVHFIDIRTDIGATSTILREYLQAGGVEIETPVATALFHGIKTDTEGLERDASRADVDAYVELLPLADLGLLNKIARPPLSEDYFQLLESALADACRFGEAVVAVIGEVDVPDYLSAVSDLLVQGKDVAWALTMGWKGGKLYLSLRIRPPRRNAGNILRKTVFPEGKGGGHALAAGGQLVPEDGDMERAARDLVDRFLRVVGMESELARPICPQRKRHRRTCLFGDGE